MSEHRDGPMAMHIRDAFIASANTPIVHLDWADKPSIVDSHLMGFGIPTRSWLHQFETRPGLRRFAPFVARTLAVRRFARWAAGQPIPIPNRQVVIKR